MSKEEVLKDYDFRESSTQAAIKLFDAICNRGWNLRQGDYEIMKGVIREFSSNYAASLVAEKEREWKDKLLSALEDGIEAGKDSTFYGSEYDYENEQMHRSGFKEKHKI